MCLGVFGVDALIFRFGVRGVVVRLMMECHRLEVGFALTVGARAGRGLRGAS